QLGAAPLQILTRLLGAAALTRARDLVGVRALEVGLDVVDLCADRAQCILRLVDAVCDAIAFVQPCVALGSSRSRIGTQPLESLATSDQHRLRRRRAGELDHFDECLESGEGVFRYES